MDSQRIMSEDDKQNKHISMMIYTKCQNRFLINKI